ncbi:MAG: hypothetical protein K0V04_22530 [Deltaproteobacteria bacterium]|nr:hypothetical protein [Deltaproteobacteria bacterium]
MLACCTDAIFATRPSHTFSGTTALVQEVLAGYAAIYVVDHDFGEGVDDPRLLTIAVNDTDEDAVRAQLAALFVRMYSIPLSPDAEEITAAYALWDGVVAHRGDPRRAWAVTLAAMMQDIRLVTY